MNQGDFTPDEEKFLNEMEPLVARTSTAAGPCPDPDVLMALRSGVLGEGADAVRSHIESCPTCRQLASDLCEYEPPGASEVEDRRIQARLEANRSSKMRHWGYWAVAAAVLVFFAGGYGIWLAKRSAGESAGKAPLVTGRATGSPAPTRVQLVFEKAPIQVPAESVLLFRGNASSRRAFMNDLAKALKPYRNDDYAGAVAQLGELSRKYPNSPEAAFYLGVSKLFLSDAPGAVESLQQARKNSDPTLRDAIEWYLAVALNRAGRDTEALRGAEALCGVDGPYKTKACSAVETLKKP